MTTNPRPIMGTLGPIPGIEGYIRFTPDNPSDMQRADKHGNPGHVEYVNVNVGHPALRARAEQRFGGINVDAAIRGETVPATIWE